MLSQVNVRSCSAKLMLGHVRLSLDLNQTVKNDRKRNMQRMIEKEIYKVGVITTWLAHSVSSEENWTTHSFKILR